jgi:hypothetical protein
MLGFGVGDGTGGMSVPVMLMIPKSYELLFREASSSN